MGTTIMGETSDTRDLLERAGGGDQDAVAALFAKHHDRLEQMVRLRMDRRLQGRIDPTDVLQETFLEVARRVVDFAEPTTSVYLCVRFLTGQKLVDLARRHLGSKMHNAGLEISIFRSRCPQASWRCRSAAQLLGRFTSPSRAAIRAETQLKVQERWMQMDPIDREVLALHHFELLFQRRGGHRAWALEGRRQQSLCQGTQADESIDRAVPAWRQGQPGQTQGNRH